MADTLQIVADTLRTMMGATAADPYIKAIERAIAAAEQEHYTLIAELPTAEEARPFEVCDDAGGTITGTVPSNANGVTAIRIYRR